MFQSSLLAPIARLPPITRHRLKRSPTADKRLWIPQPLVASYPNNSSRCRGPELDDGSTCALLGALQFEPGPHFQRAKTGACLITGTLSIRDVHQERRCDTEKMLSRSTEGER